MLINADFSRTAIVAPDQQHWVASPQGGVERVMLDRVGEEKARATSFVRYAPHSTFPRHLHPGGEEIFVLSGTFSDGEGHYPAGWYLRNPPGSSHQPFSVEGAEIFVKLWQMPAQQTRTVRIDTRDVSAWQHIDGVDVCPLFDDESERVCLQRLAPGNAVSVDSTHGAELLVLSGSVVMDGKCYEPRSWIRLPPGHAPRIRAEETQATTIYLKTGHLAQMTRMATAA